MEKSSAYSPYRILFIVILIILVLISWYVYAKRNSIKLNNTAAPAPVLLFDLSSSGSTNLAPWNLYFYNDGSAKLMYSKVGTGSNAPTKKNRAYAANIFNSVEMKDDLKQINFTNLPTCTVNDETTLSATLLTKNNLTVVYKGHKLSSFCINNKPENDLLESFKNIYSTVNP